MAPSPTKPAPSGKLHGKMAWADLRIPPKGDSQAELKFVQAVVGASPKVVGASQAFPKASRSAPTKAASKIPVRASTSSIKVSRLELIVGDLRSQHQQLSAQIDAMALQMAGIVTRKAVLHKVLKLHDQEQVPLKVISKLYPVVFEQYRKKPAYLGSNSLEDPIDVDE